MKLYVVIEDINDYPECGGGEFPDEVFVNYASAVKYAIRKQQEADALDEFHTGRTTWRVETWKTADEKENQE